MTDDVDRDVLERDRVAKPVAIDTRDRGLLGAAAAGARQRGARPRDDDRPPRHARPAAGASRRRAADPRHVGHPRLLQTTGCHRGVVPRRVALHGRSRLPARRRARAVRADQGRHHRRRPERVPGGHRARRRWSRRRSRRQRDRVRGRGLQGEGDRRRRCRGADRRGRPRSGPRSTTARSRCAGCRRAT